MLSYISTREASAKWEISSRRIALLCAENKIEGAIMVGNLWMIPADAEKPGDVQSGKNNNNKNSKPYPFVKWVGGKSRMIERLEKFIPEDGRLTKFVEPMVGGGALFFNVLFNNEFEEYYICDTNKELINSYIAVRDNVEVLIESLLDMQFAYLPMDENGRKFYYYSVRDKFNKTPLNENTSTEKAAWFLFLNKTCFNGLYRVNKKGQFNVPMGAYKNPLICDEDNLRNVSAVLKNVKILCGDYTLCDEYIDEKTFVYIDPPYRPISATAAFTSYNIDCFDDNEQIRLAEFLKGLDKKGATVVLSNSDPKNVNPDDNFFEDLYCEFNIHRVSAPRMINSKGDNRGNISELIITNAKTSDSEISNKSTIEQIKNESVIDESIVNE